MAKLAQVIALVLVLLAASIPAIYGQRRGTVRLVRNGATSTSYTSGRVQIYLSSWGNICDDFQFGLTEAIVICHQLGYSSASSYSRSSVDSFGSLSSIALDDVGCFTSNYLTILQCSHSTYIGSDCVGGSDDVSVTCLSTRIWNSPYDLQIRLSQGLYTSQGLVEVYCNREWGTVCDDTFGLTDANTVCKQLGYTGAARYDNLPYRGSGRIWLNNVACSSFDSCLRSCERCPSNEYHNCVHSEDVTIECEYASELTVSNQLTTCNFGITIPGLTINIPGIIGGVIAAIIVCTILPIAIPIFIRCCLGVGIGAACRNDSRPRTRHVTIAPPPPTSAVVVTSSTTNTSEKAAYPVQQPYPQTNPPPPAYSAQPGYPAQPPQAYPAQPPQAYPAQPQAGYPPPDQPGAVYPTQAPGEGAYPPPGSDAGAYPPPQDPVYPPQGAPYP